MAKEIDEKIEDIARYLREKGINLRCLQYSYFSGESGERYLHIDTIVGKEPRRGTLPLAPEVIPEIYKMFDKVLEEIKTDEFAAPEVFRIFGVLFPNEMAKLQEKYKDTPHFSVKTYIAKRLFDYSKRESASFFVTEKLTRAPADWGWPEVKVFRKKH